MEEKKPANSEDDGSLVPLLEAEEEKLAALLEEARADADRRVAVSERAAAEELESFPRQLPWEVDEERARLVEQIESEVAINRTTLLHEVESYEHYSRPRVKKAAEALVGILLRRNE